MGRPEEDEMDILMNLEKAKRLAARKAIENDRPQPLVAAYGGWVVPTADEYWFDLAGAEEIAVYQPMD